MMRKRRPRTDPKDIVCVCIIVTDVFKFSVCRKLEILFTRKYRFRRSSTFLFSHMNELIVEYVRFILHGEDATN